MADRAIPRVDQLSKAPVLGRTYMVPVVHAEYLSLVSDWPITGHEHTDIEHFNFEAPHYHIDIRFLTREQLRVVSPAHDFRMGPTYQSPLQRRLARIMATPLSGMFVKPYDGGKREALPNPNWTELRCRRKHPGWKFPNAGPVHEMQSHYAGRICDRGKHGFICPHRQAPLGSTEPVDGVITCPLHGLRIDANTGRVLDAPAKQTEICL